ncbi:hypothetical protein [Pseudoruegeria sp. HB172150]|uniref:hypothetical protein n=1 Tax=Pseudoruegeria sp. HB172150 TaxID=2721164 RepID=UPI0015582098|nr:hypothetical protein [Pseudoruegeria sp. HB172150]
MSDYRASVRKYDTTLKGLEQPLHRNSPSGMAWAARTGRFAGQLPNLAAARGCNTPVNAESSPFETRSEATGSNAKRAAGCPAARVSTGSNPVYDLLAT